MNILDINLDKELYEIKINEKTNYIYLIKLREFINTIKLDDIVMVDHIDIFMERYKKFDKSIVLSIVNNPDIIKYFEKKVFNTINLIYLVKTKLFFNWQISLTNKKYIKKPTNTMTVYN
jgi:hypothetical protein